MLLSDALKELAERVKEEIIRRLHSPLGINHRAKGKNTLVGSHLETTIDVKPIDDETIVFEIADYYLPIVAGRKAGWKNRPRKREGIVKGIEDWVKNKKISFKSGMTQTQTVWVVLEALEVRAIAARPFIGYDPKELSAWAKNPDGDFEGANVELILPFLKDYFEAWKDDVYKLITDKIDKYF